MGAAKWIGGIIGFMAGGPLGALAGFVFGSLFDTDSSDAGSYYGEEPTHGTTYTGQRNTTNTLLSVPCANVPCVE